MSRENVELVHSGLDAFNHRDLRALAELSHEDLEFVTVLTAVEAGGATYRGSETWASYFADMNEAWEEWRVEDFRVFDAGDDRVAAVFRIVGKGKHSGVPVEHPIGVAYRIRQGKIWRMRSYLDPAEALEAVGLAE
jgi:ketosteroid isomerase-like protein